jgi:two-component system response regulator AtoC
LVEGEIRALGASQTVAVDVRVIAATSRDLSKQIRDGKFREDLYHRLNVLSIHVPPLRERKEDVEALIDHFCRKFETRLKLRDLKVNDEARQVLKDYDWPGNVRELENALERAFVLSDGPHIGVTDLDERFFKINPDKSMNRNQDSGDASQVAEPGDLKLKPKLGKYEKQLIQEALDQCGGNRAQAAKLLGISQRSLLYKLKDYGLS